MSALKKLHRPAKQAGIDVGGRLKSLRLKLGLSQRDVAQLAGVTNGMISSIEQNKHSPSVTSLKKITDVLGVGIADFFQESPPQSHPVFFGPDDLEAVEEDELKFFVVAGARREKALQIMREHYQPGADTGPDMLAHAGEEGGFVLSGEVEVTVGSESRRLVAGESYYFDSNVPHRFRNLGKEDAVIISACSPPSL